MPQFLMQRPDLAERPGLLVLIKSIFLLVLTLAVLVKFR